MSNVIRLPLPRLKRPRPARLGFFVRVGRNDPCRAVASDPCAEGWASHERRETIMRKRRLRP